MNIFNFEISEMCLFMGLFSSRGGAVHGARVWFGKKEREEKERKNRSFKSVYMLIVYARANVTGGSCQSMWRDP